MGTYIDGAIRLVPYLGYSTISATLDNVHETHDICHIFTIFTLI